MLKHTWAQPPALLIQSLQGVVVNCISQELLMLLVWPLWVLAIVYCVLCEEEIDSWAFLLRDLSVSFCRWHTRISKGQNRTGQFQRELATLWETGSFYWTVIRSQSCELAAWGSLGRKILLLQCGDGYGGLCLWSPHSGGWGRMVAPRSSQPLLQPVPG